MKAPNTQRCIACGKFMDCADLAAHCDFTPDSDRGSESVEWTCGPCYREANESKRRAEEASQQVPF